MNYFKGNENVNLNMVSSTSDHRSSGETINEKGLNSSERLKPVPTCGIVSPLYNQLNCYCMATVIKCYYVSIVYARTNYQQCPLKMCISFIKLLFLSKTTHHECSQQPNPTKTSNKYISFIRSQICVPHCEKSIPSRCSEFFSL